MTKPISREDWQRLMPKGLWYTAKQVSLRAVPPIKEVTARRWLQHGVGANLLDVRLSGVRKRYKVRSE